MTLVDHDIDTAPEETIDLRRYLTILIKWYRLIVLFAILGALVAFVMSSLRREAYEAEATVAIVRTTAQLNFDPKFRTISGTDPTTTSVDLVSLRKTLTTIADSNDLGAAVFVALNGQLDSSFENASTLHSAVKVSNDGDLIVIHAQATTPAQAAQIANTWAQVYTTRVNQIYSQTLLAPAELQRQGDEARQDYDTKQQALIAYLKQSDTETLTLQQKLVSAQLDDLNSTQIKLNRLLSDAQALRTRTSSQNTPDGTRGDQLAGLLLEASAFSSWSNLPVSLQIPIEQLAQSSTPADQVRNLDTLIAALQEREKTVENSSKQNLVQQLNSLQAQIELENSKQSELTAARDLTWQTYQTLASKLAETNVASQATNSYVRLASAAVVPDVAVAGRRALNTLLGAIVGLLLGGVLAFVLDFRDQRLYDAERVQSALRLPIRSAIPRAAVAEFSSKANLLGLSPRSDDTLAEPFRVLRHHFFTLGRQIVTITSAETGDGKSTVAANLAGVMAQAGRKVLLIDANLRQPVLHDRFGVERGRGLADLLMGANDAAGWGSYVRTTSVENLALFTAGSPTSDPSGLLENPSFGAFLTKARSIYEFIIIDTPAVLAMSDALAVARVSETILFVVDSQRTTIGEAKQAQSSLTETGVLIDGIVLNRTFSAPSSGVVGGTPAAPMRHVPAKPRAWAAALDRFAELLSSRPG